MSLRKKLIRLAYENPELREELLPLISQQDNQREAAFGGLKLKWKKPFVVEKVFKFFKTLKPGSEETPKDFLQNLSKDDAKKLVSSYVKSKPEVGLIIAIANKAGYKPQD